MTSVCTATDSHSESSRLNDCTICLSASLSMTLLTASGSDLSCASACIVRGPTAGGRAAGGEPRGGRGRVSCSEESWGSGVVRWRMPTTRVLMPREK